MGPVGAHNYEPEHFSGEWAHFLNVDDVLLAEALHQSLRYLNKSLDLLLLVSGCVAEITGDLLSYLSSWRMLLMIP